MDVSVKGLEPQVVARLAEQAEVEGVSAQEWMRAALRRTAALLTPRELSQRVTARRPVSEGRFRETMGAVTKRRASKTSAAAKSVRHRRR